MATPAPSDALTIQNIAARLRTREWTAAAVAEECLRRVHAWNDPALFIDRITDEQVMAQARRADESLAAGDTRPLLGIPYVVKDNIDVAGHATTAACPDFAYRPARSATAVRRLTDSGAVLLGKTNLDQFATGLNGTRSPFGTARNAFNAAFIPGGSSSGSATAVAAGLASFSLGTDTAGSGRVPAAFNNIVGLKPTCGRISTAGLVPACRSIDCVSIFALTCADAATVAGAIEGYDPQDPYSRQDRGSAGPFPQAFRFGIPADDRLNFFQDPDAQALYRRAITTLTELGGTPVTIDYAPFADAGALLYDGPWVSERLAGLREFIADRPDSILPITRGILQSGRRFDAVAAFDGFHELRNLHRLAAAQWAKMELLFLPTAGTIYTLEEIRADPLRRNANLGYYTTFVNLLDLAAVATPAGFLSNGMPLGVSLIAPAGYDDALLELADRLHRAQGTGLGAPKYPFPESVAPAVRARPMVKIAVVGAHLTGQPLNHQLTTLNGRLLQTTRTAPSYQLFALPGTRPPKPGLQRTSGPGAAIEVEVWELTEEAFGKFVAAVPPPMTIGTVTLENGQEVKSFLCEALATAGARDISHFGGWRSYLQSQ